MNELQLFNFNGSNVRTLLIEDEPYFVGKDVADILGYSRSDNAIRSHVREKHKLTHQIDASGQKRNMTIISEPGLYSLIMKSKAPRNSLLKTPSKIAARFTGNKALEFNKLQNTR